MKPLEIKGARTRLGYKQRHMAEKLGMTLCTYNRKENGKSEFTDAEKVKVAELLGFTLEQMNDFLFDGLLPISSNQRTM